MLLLLRYLLLLISPLLFGHLVSFIVSLVVRIHIRTHELFKIYLVLSIIILVHFHKFNNANLPKNTNIFRNYTIIILLRLILLVVILPRILKTITTAVAIKVAELHAEVTADKQF